MEVLLENHLESINHLVIVLVALIEEKSLLFKKFVVEIEILSVVIFSSSNFSPVLQYKMGVDDGPTVKEHLQQQARHRMRQDILSKRTMDDEHVRPGLLVKR